MEICCDGNKCNNVNNWTRSALHRHRHMVNWTWKAFNKWSIHFRLQVWTELLRFKQFWTNICSKESFLSRNEPSTGTKLCIQLTFFWEESWTKLYSSAIKEEILARRLHLRMRSFLNREGSCRPTDWLSLLVLLFFPAVPNAYKSYVISAT